MNQPSAFSSSPLIVFSSAVAFTDVSCQRLRWVCVCVCVCVSTDLDTKRTSGHIARWKEAAQVWAGSLFLSLFCRDTRKPWWGRDPWREKEVSGHFFLGNSRAGRLTLCAHTHSDGSSLSYIVSAVQLPAPTPPPPLSLRTLGYIQTDRQTWGWCWPSCGASLATKVRHRQTVSQCNC